MRPRVFFVSNHLRGTKGAAGTRSWQQAKILSESFDVTVALPATDPVTTLPVTPETYEGLDPDHVKVKLVKSVKLDRSRKWKRAVFYLVSSIGQLWQGLRSGRADCILTMSLPVTSLWVGLILSWVNRCPLVVDVRDLPFETAEEMGYLTHRRLTHLGIGLENFALRRARAIICNSPYYKPMLAARGLSEHNIEVAVIGYDDFHPPSAREIADARKDLEGMFREYTPEKLGVYCGTFGHVVEVEVVLNAAKILKHRHDIGFVFVGGGQRLDEYQSIVQAEGLNVQFTGRVSKDRIQPICRAGDFCLYAAKAGKMSAAMLGNKIFDYLGAERPVLFVGPKGAVSDVVKETDAGLISDADDAHSLAAAIEKICGDEVLHAQLSSNASRFRDYGYSAKESAQRVHDVVAGLLGSQR